MLDDLILCSACGEKIHNGSWHYGCVESGGIGEGVALDDLLENAIASTSEDLNAEIEDLDEQLTIANKTIIRKENLNIELKKELKVISERNNIQAELIAAKYAEIARLQGALNRLTSPLKKG